MMENNDAELPCPCLLSKHSDTRNNEREIQKDSLVV